MHCDVHKHAEDDLEKLWDSDPDAAATIVATLEQAAADPQLIDKLTQHGDNLFGATLLNVKRWQKARGGRSGDLWRFRILNTPATNHRVVYGYNFRTRQICVLAVVAKDDFDYDDLSSDIAQRILSDWRSL